MPIFLIQLFTVFALDCNPNACDPTEIGDSICSPSCMNEPCNYDSSESKFLDKIAIIKASDCFESCTSSDHGCTLEMLENDICDDGKIYIECNIKECAWDVGHCGYCEKNCFEYKLGDGICNEECDIAECRYDLNDCGWCSHDCKLELINNGICNTECYNSDCDYDGKDCGCAPNCKFDDYGKCKPACMVPDCNYDSMGTQCQYEDLREYYRYGQLLYRDFSIPQNIDVLDCPSYSYKNSDVDSIYCPAYALYTIPDITTDLCQDGCLGCTDFSNCLSCDYSNGYFNLYTNCVSVCFKGYSNHPLIPSICYKNKDPSSYSNPTKIYVDCNTTNHILDGSKENPFMTLYDAITYNTNSSYIEILLKPGIHEISYEIPVNPIIFSLTIRSDCSDCTEYAFLNITNSSFSFPTNGIFIVTFVNLIIDRKSVNGPYDIYADDITNDFFICPLVNFINLISIGSDAKFYTINTTFQNIKYLTLVWVKLINILLKLKTILI